MPPSEGDLASLPRTRRSQAKAERRLDLIEATITAIAEFGISGTTMGKVTEIAGTSVGLVNFHFESKERLFEAVLTHLANIERSQWQKGNEDLTRTPAERLIAFADARFHARACDRRTLAVWFAFWGDAGARDIYRRVVEDLDEERLEAAVGIIENLNKGRERLVLDAYQTALGLEAFYDGLWLNLLLYPSDFKRSACRQRALEHLAALFPAQIGSGAAAAADPAATAAKGS